MSRTNPKEQRGVSILFATLIVSVVLSIGLGVSTILIQQAKVMSQAGDAVVSFYAADSGVEEQLFDLYKATEHLSQHSGTIAIAANRTATFSTIARCSANVSAADCVIERDDACQALNYCIKSVGSYQKTKRAIEIQY